MLRLYELLFLAHYCHQINRWKVWNCCAPDINKTGTLSCYYWSKTTQVPLDSKMCLLKASLGRLSFTVQNDDTLSTLWRLFSHSSAAGWKFLCVHFKSLFKTWTSRILWKCHVESCHLQCTRTHRKALIHVWSKTWARSKVKISTEMKLEMFLSMTLALLFSQTCWTQPV